MAEHICLCCGADLTDQEPRELGDLRLDSYGDSYYKNTPIHLTRTERIIVISLIKADGQFITYEGLKNRIYGPDSERAETCDNNIISVWINRIRKRFAEADPNFDRIETAGRGRWAGGMVRWKL